MAGPYVHCMVSREALRNISKDTSFNRYSKIINPNEKSQYFPYICLGSVSPDYPYPAMTIDNIIPGARTVNTAKDENGWTWGDKFHKERTGDVVDIGVRALRTDPDAKVVGWTDAWLKKAAWLMGYYSHVITDLAIHAVVYKLVGGCYENHKKQHLHCEVVQDALLFYDVYSIPPKAPQELVNANFLKILQRCQEYAAVDPFDPFKPETYVLDNKIVKFWDSILSQNYGDKYDNFYNTETPQINAWHQWYGFIVKEGTGLPARWLEPNMAYHKTTEIDDAEKNEYYSGTVLPNNSEHKSYRNDVFNYTVGVVTERLKIFLNSLDDSTVDNKLGDWNIDKGTVDDESYDFVLWSPWKAEPFDCPGPPPDPPWKG